MNEMYKYGNLYEKYGLEDGTELKVGTGILKVHDLFDPVPDFMKEADVVFCDPPCSKANINSFYTKAEKNERVEYSEFEKRFWEVIDEISPNTLFIELFASNKDFFISECKKRYANIRVTDSMYYRNPRNKCWIAQASNFPLYDIPIEGIDEEKVIATICKEVDFKCIADPCMGKGLVAFYANKNGKKFAGTELSKYRLGVCVERVSTGKRGGMG